MKPYSSQSPREDTAEKTSISLPFGNRESLKSGLCQDILPQYTRTLRPQEGSFHFHEDYELFLFLDGRADILVEQSRYALQRGSLLAFHSSEVHRASPDPAFPYERLVVHFHPRVIQNLPLDPPPLLSCFLNRRPGEKNAVVLQGEELEGYIKAGLRLVAAVEKKPSFWEGESLSCLLEILVRANRAFQKELALSSKLPLSHFVEDAMAYVSHFLSAPLTVSQVAKHLHVDVSYLSHCFREQTGVSLYHYILMKKIALARTLLSAGASVAEACEGSGFGDCDNFSRTFKKYVGTSPGKYRVLHKGG